MNQEMRTAIANAIRVTGKYYGKDIDLEVLTMMVDDLVDLPVTDVLKAYGDYRRDPKMKFFPMPSAIREMIQPTVSDDARAKEIASRVREAVSKFGWSNPVEAEVYVGSIGWTLVQRFGGWLHICENLGLNIPETTFLAQVRDLAKSQLELGKAGQLNNPAILEHGAKDELSPPSKSFQKILDSVAIKTIPKTVTETNKAGE
jgi:hypothetical protein